MFGSIGRGEIHGVCVMEMRASRRSGRTVRGATLYLKRVKMMGKMMGDLV